MFNVIPNLVYRKRGPAFEWVDTYWDCASNRRIVQTKMSRRGSLRHRGPRGVALRSHRLGFGWRLGTNMSKGKDFRAPRKRGFDDDGPMPYKSRPRPGRSYGGSPDGGGFGGPAMGGQPPPRSTRARRRSTRPSNGSRRTRAMGSSSWRAARATHSCTRTRCMRPAMTTFLQALKLRVQVGAGAKGAQVTRVLEVDTAGVVERPRRPSSDGLRPRRVAPDPSTAVSVIGKVKMVRRRQGIWLCR